MPLIASFLVSSILPALGQFLVLLLPLFAGLVRFSLPRILKIPSYLRLLRILYSDTRPESDLRRKITSGFLLLGGILTFMSYSLIPWTGVPVVGSVTTPIAIVLATVIALTLLDSVFTANRGYLLNKLQDEGFAGIEDVEADIAELKEVFGRSWKKVSHFVKKSCESAYQEGRKKNIDFDSDVFEDFVDRAFSGLSLYTVRDANELSDEFSIDSFKAEQSQWLEELSSVGAGTTLGLGAFLGTSSVASSLFVQASWLTSVQGLLGISTGGAVVSATTYSLLTLAAPVGLAGLAGLGVYGTIKKRKAKEKAKEMSHFLSDTMKAALPMAWIDGEFSPGEQDAIDRFAVKYGLLEEDRDSIYQEIDERKSFEDVMRSGILFDEQYRALNCSQSEEERAKHRLILCTAWEIAVSDNVIRQEEIVLHNRMADKLNISRTEAIEIRRTISLSHWQELALGDRSVDFREQYQLQGTTRTLG